MLPPDARLIGGLQQALKMYSSISSFYVSSLQQLEYATPVFMFGLHLSLVAGSSNIIKQQRAAANKLITSLLSADTTEAFAGALFNVYSQKPVHQHLQTLLEQISDSLLTSIFQHLQQIQPDFTGQVLSQVKVKIDYSQFIQSDIVSLRLAAV